MDINNTLLFKFFAKENSASEADAIAAWLKESEKNVQEFEKAYKLFALSQVALSGLATERQAHTRKRLRTIARWSIGAMAAAAAIVVGIFISNHFSRESMIKDAILVSEAKWGKQVTQTLADGTIIELNSGSRIEYPALFIGNERRVKLEGEAIFDVTPDKEQPFIVETYAFDIRVTGTRFDVVANKDDEEFSTTLLEGSVELLDKSQNVLVRLQPNQIARMDENGSLHTETLDDVREEILWTKDLISLAGIPFTEMMRRFEKAFGVNIVIEMADVPDEVLPYCTVRISEGVVSAFSVLQHHYGFDYVYDVQSNTYHIK